MVSEADWAVVVARSLPGSRLVGFEPLKGGVSGVVHRLDLQTPMGRRQVVARRPSGADWKTEEIDVEVEFALLSALAARFPVPAVLALDPGPPPSLLMECIDGAVQVELEAALPQMAAALARLHRLDLDTLSLPRMRERTHPGVPNVLLHGDFWWGNLLWKEGQLQAVIDWEDAAIGDANSDLAGARIEILWTHGAEVMDRFTQLYLEHNPLDTATLRHWELFVAEAAAGSMQHWGLPAEKEARMRRRTEAFLSSGWEGG